MTDTLTRLNALRRPRLLIRAARIGAQEYRRNAHLQRHLGYGALPNSALALRRLVEMETALEDQRRLHDTGYSPARHVEILIAMMGEAWLLRSTQATPVT